MLFRSKFYSGRINITENWQKKLISHVFKGNGEFTTGKEECVGGGAPPTNQMAKVVEVSEIG